MYNSSLNDTQSKSLGSNIPSYIYSDALACLYSEPHSDYLDSEDTLQSFDEFVEMGNHEPDELGNGRHLFTPRRRTIALITLGVIPNLKSFLSATKQLLSGYFCLEITQLPSLDLAKIHNKWSIVDELNNSYYPLIKSPSKLNVYSILDVLTHYLHQSHYCIIALTAAPLYDPEIPNSTILGRASGDRVCVIHTSKNRRETVGTVLHECMHTMGIDHCIAWTCIMNSQSHSFLQVCPGDLYKLQHAIGFDMETRLDTLSKVYKHLKWRTEYNYCKEYLKILKLYSLT